MTDKELEAIVLEYTDSVYNGVDMTDADMRESYNDSCVMYDYFLRHILKKHEIVSKDKLRMEFDKAENEEGDTRAWIESRGKLRLLKSLFPQTLKTEEHGNSDN